MGSTAKSQKQQQSPLLKISLDIQMLAADIGLQSLSRDAVLGECF